MRAQIGLVAHQAYLYEELSALENLLFFARMYAVPQARERSLSLLSACRVSAASQRTRQHILTRTGATSRRRAPCCMSRNCSCLMNRILVWTSKGMR